MSDGIYQSDRATFWHRVVSGAVFVVWLLLGYTNGGLQGMLRAFLFFLLPIYCIWFPEAMGQYKGAFLGRGRAIDEASHPAFLRYAAWFLLLGVPLICWLLFMRDA